MLRLHGSPEQLMGSLLVPVAGVLNAKSSTLDFQQRFPSAPGAEGVFANECC